MAHRRQTVGYWGIFLALAKKIHFCLGCRTFFEELTLKIKNRNRIVFVIYKFRNSLSNLRLSSRRSHISHKSYRKSLSMHCSKKNKLEIKILSKNCPIWFLKSGILWSKNLNLRWHFSNPLSYEQNLNLFQVSMTKTLF